jgi:hypothetical protein
MNAYERVNSLHNHVEAINNIINKLLLIVISSLNILDIDAQYETI